MALPRKLKHLNIFNAGNNWMGIAESVTLPKFTRKLENYRGGGMPGSVGIDLGLDDGALDTEMTIGGTEALLFKQMGKATVDGVQLRWLRKPGQDLNAMWVECEDVLFPLPQWDGYR